MGFSSLKLNGMSTRSVLPAEDHHPAELTSLPSPTQLRSSNSESKFPTISSYRDLLTLSSRVVLTTRAYALTIICFSYDGHAPP